VRIGAALIGCVMVCACARPERGVGEPALWAVDTAPRLTVGTMDADPGHELAGVSGVRILAGILIIANSGSFELRRFDSLGRYLGAEGRKGQGPGEFLGRIALFPAPGDSLYTLDDQNLRWSIHDGSGRYARVLPGGQAALPRPTWLYHRTIVASNTPGPAPEWTRVLLAGLPDAPREAPVRNARFDDLGYLWVTDTLASNIWTIYADSGLAVGRVVLPAGFALLQAGDDFVLGVETGAMDQEIVRAYGLHRPAGLSVPGATPPAEFTRRDPALEGRMLADVRGLLMAQEVFYSEHASYSAKADSLNVAMSSGAELVMLAGDRRHWAAVLYHRSTRTTCGLSVGAPTPAGWLDGMPFCGKE